MLRTSTAELLKAVWALSKTAGNYAASLIAQEIAEERGYTQVLWLDGVEKKYIEEVGTMNIMVRYKQRSYYT